jgi:Ca2+-transporting ATPase
MTTSPRDWYRGSIEQLCDHLQTTPNGLSSAETQKRLQQFGPNQLPLKAGDGPLKILFRQIHNPLIYVLLGSGLLAIVMGKGTDGLVVLGVVLVNALIGFVQEYRSGKELAALRNMVPDTTTVIRDGHAQTLDAALLVPGDIVRLASGDRVPADLRLIDARSLSIMEAALTGESLPSEKSTTPITTEAALGDRKNMAFSGTAIASGTALGVVVETGLRTELGKINQMLSETINPQTPLTRSIAQVAKGLTITILIVAAFLFALALLRGYPLIDAVLASITLAVAAIPEGIPAIITIALAIGVRRMAQRRAVIRHLPAVETLGSTTVICSDKTGTITKNEMTVVDALTLTHHARFSGAGYAPEGQMSVEGTDHIPDELTELLIAGVVCNDASLRCVDNSWRIEGDPTEGALLTAARKAGMDIEALRAAHSRADVIPFESEHKFMATMHAHSDHATILLKGAPEVVAARCKLDTTTAAHVQRTIDSLASEGKRVLAFAQKQLPANKLSLSMDDATDGFRFLGLQAMIDPPREEVKAAIARCHAAGICVKMITGDHQATAAAIGRELKIATAEGALSGAQLDKMNDSELAHAASTVNIFARVAPEHKIKLVSILQQQGQVVAMTGDGVNDAPALKKADIGVAMGITGTDVSKDAAAVVLTDDNFTTIVAAVEEGRRVYDNLIKSLAFALPTNFGEALILLAAVAFFPIINGVPLLPMTPVQILWINLVATVSLALPLAFEAKEQSIMSRPPRKRDEPLMNRFILTRTLIVALIITVVALGLFLHVFNRQILSGIAQPIALATAQTMAVTSIVFLQIFYLLNCRSLRQSIFSIGLFSNKSVLWGILILLGLQITFVHIPAMNTLFGSAPLSLLGWLECALVGAVVLPVISLEKAIRNRKAARLSATIE